MYRRLLTVALLPSLLLPPAEALGHSHGNSQPADHDLRAHVHFDDHLLGGHDDPNCPDDADDHDDDALYLVPGAIPLSQIASGQADFDTSIRLSSLMADSLFFVETADWYMPRPHPPPGATLNCTLYVLHLALLI